MDFTKLRLINSADFCRGLYQCIGLEEKKQRCVCVSECVRACVCESKYPILSLLLLKLWLSCCKFVSIAVEKKVFILLVVFQPFSAIITRRGSSIDTEKVFSFLCFFSQGRPLLPASFWVRLGLFPRHCCDHSTVSLQFITCPPTGLTCGDTLTL